MLLDFLADVLDALVGLWGIARRTISELNWGRRGPGLDEGSKPRDR